MLIGLVGAHRVGKTTLAKKAEEVLGLTYVPASVTKTFERLGVSPRHNFTFMERLEIQREVLKDAEVSWSAGAQTLGISDRTPIDMIAYMMAEVGPETINSNPGAEKLLLNYIADCKLAVKRHFKALLVVRPGIPIVDDPTKASPCPFYIAHLDRIMAGFSLDTGLDCEVVVLNSSVTEMDRRLYRVAQILKNMVKNEALNKEGEKTH
jgi:hypothetical protein